MSKIVKCIYRWQLYKKRNDFLCFVAERFEACGFSLSYQDQVEGPEIALVSGLERD